jgi:hypothetical protein
MEKMNRFILLVISVYFLVSCRQENSKNPIRKQTNKSSSLTKNSLLKKNKPEDDMLNHLKEKYSNVYAFEFGSNDEAEGKEIQYLAINYLENKNIDFYLYTETLPCDTEYFGLAYKEDHSEDLTIFTKEENEYKISIQLNRDKSEATINYIQKDSIETDCLPIDQTIMKQIK